MSKNVYQDKIYKKGNSYFTEEYLKHNHLDEKEGYELFTGSVFDLSGTKVRCNYSQIFFNDSNMVLCNGISKINDLWMDGIENGSLFYYEDLSGNRYSYEEAQEKIEEFEEEIEKIKEELEEVEFDPELEEKISEIENEINALEDEKNDEIFQWYIIDDSTAKRLKEHTDEVIYYDDTLDVYVLCVTHWGTSWDYVGAEFTF